MMPPVARAPRIAVQPWRSFDLACRVRRSGEWRPETMTGPNEALCTILPIAGWSDGQAAAVAFTGGFHPRLAPPLLHRHAGAPTLRRHPPGARERAAQRHPPSPPRARDDLPNT